MAISVWIYACLHKLRLITQAGGVVGVMDIDCQLLEVEVKCVEVTLELRRLLLSKDFRSVVT